MANIDLSTGIRVSSQIPTDPKIHFNTIEDLQDLGDNNLAPYTYYDGMITLCAETQKLYIWREKRLNEPQGILETDFVYPPNASSNGIDYGDRAFNFFIYNVNSTRPNQVLSGGYLSWQGGFEYLVTPLEYILNNQIYSSLGGTVTHSAADATYDRIDAIVVDVNGTVLILEGDATAIPSEPIINPSLYTLITYVDIPANSTTLPVTIKDIYQENDQEPTEFNTQATDPLVTLDADSFPSVGSTCIYHKGSNNGYKEILFTVSEILNTADYSTIEFDIRLDGLALGHQDIFSIGFAELDGIVHDKLTLFEGHYNYSDMIFQEYQRVVIPLADFPNLPSQFRRIVVIIGNNEQGAFRLDNIVLTSGVPSTITEDSFLSLNDVYENSYQGKAGYHAVVNGSETGMILEKPYWTRIENNYIVADIHKADGNTNNAIVEDGDIVRDALFIDGALTYRLPYGIYSNVLGLADDYHNYETPITT